MRNDNKYKGFRAGGRGGDENLPFSLIFIGFHENWRNLQKKVILHKMLILQLFRARAPEPT